MTARTTSATNTHCTAGLSIGGKSFRCDWPAGTDGRHDGWAHTNGTAQAQWVSDRDPVPGKPAWEPSAQPPRDPAPMTGPTTVGTATLDHHAKLVTAHHYALLNPATTAGQVRAAARRSVTDVLDTMNTQAFREALAETQPDLADATTEWECATELIAQIRVLFGVGA